MKTKHRTSKAYISQGMLACQQNMAASGNRTHAVTTRDVLWNETFFLTYLGLIYAYDVLSSVSLTLKY